MGRTLRIAAVHLALAAMLLRALVPAGWMPDAHGALVLCTLDGAIHDAGDPAHKPSEDGHQGACPFAAAPHLAPPAAIAALALPAIAGQLADPSSLAAAAAPVSLYQPQSPRAPPLRV